MLKRLAATASVLAMLSGAAVAEPVKVGMITTLSGGGAGLGIDVRDGFLLAVKQAGNSDLEVIVEDDQRKPDVAVKLADKLVQSEDVDVLTGIIWSNLAMAVVPSVTAQGKVIPHDKVKVIQHLEGGIIKKINVRENATVKVGDPLME